jgi:flavin reductase (DIM6/NTAB) family NADH-FMN oxidoreductase RutF
MSKIELGNDRLLLTYPMPCAIVGANIDKKANYITIAWFSMVNPKPPYLALAMNKSHYSNTGIKANETFSVNIPSSTMADKTDYCGKIGRAHV